MNGVEILSSETIYNTFLPEWCLAIGFISMIVLGFLLAYSASRERIIFAIVCIILMTVSFFAMCLSNISNGHDVDYIEYKVTIDDSVSMNEFLDKYEIIDQEGKIYTVKENNK